MSIYSAEVDKRLAEVFEYRGPQLDNIRIIMYHLRTEYLDPDTDRDSVRKEELKEKIVAEYDLFATLFAAMQTMFNDYMNEACAVVHDEPWYYTDYLNTLTGGKHRDKN